jgi:hypothetical protein
MIAGHAGSKPVFVEKKKIRYQGRNFGIAGDPRDLPDQQCPGIPAGVERGEDLIAK